MTAHGDVESAREAFRAHAVDFLEKPIDHTMPMKAIDEALVLQTATRNRDTKNTESEQSLAKLTHREREVMELVVKGMHNEEIDRLLGISVRTVEVRRAQSANNVETVRKRRV